MEETGRETPKKSRIRTGHLWIAFGGLLFVILFYFYSVYPARSVGPEQPIPFSHRIHAGVKQINCRFCHSSVEISQDAGLPAVEKCFFCHKYVIPDHPEIRKEKSYFDARKPMAWVRVFWTPEFVFFRHEPHVRWAGLDCTNCHGAVKNMDRLRRVEFQMGFCVTCHRRMNAQLDCWLACHR
jgi:hypothetical protein